MVSETSTAKPRQARAKVLNFVNFQIKLKFCGELNIFPKSGCMVGDGASTWGSLPSLDAKEDDEAGVRGIDR